MLKKLCNVIILCILSAFLCSGCTHAAKPKDIVIGVAWPFAENNDLFSNGIDLAVREINSNGGIGGRNLKLLKEDDGSDLEKGMAIAQAFADNKEIQAVIGHFNSFISIPASTIYNNAGLVMFPGIHSPGIHPLN